MADLVQYGIAEEETDMRAHVCVVVRRIYTYPTKPAVRLVTTKKFPVAPAFQGNQKTAEGYLVPPSVIPYIRQFELPDFYWTAVPIRPEMTTSEKGAAATKLVQLAMQDGLIALPLQAHLITNLELQIKGVDILVNFDAGIQVKCDYNGGPKAFGGSGNLFIQISEANPFKRH